MAIIRTLVNRDCSTLSVYKKSIDWAEAINNVAEMVSGKTLRLALKKHSNKVPVLIANGNSQFYLSIERDAYKRALNKVKEVQMQLSSIYEAGYIEENELNKLNGQTDEICKMLIGMMKKVANEIKGS